MGFLRCWGYANPARGNSHSIRSKTRPMATSELVIVAEHRLSGHRERATCQADCYGEIAAILSELVTRC